MPTHRRALGFGRCVANDPHSPLAALAVPGRLARFGLSTLSCLRNARILDSYDDDRRPRRGRTLLLRRMGVHHAPALRNVFVFLGGHGVSRSHCKSSIAR